MYPLDTNDTPNSLDATRLHRHLHWNYCLAHAREYAEHATALAIRHTLTAHGGALITSHRLGRNNRAVEWSARDRLSMRVVHRTQQPALHCAITIYFA